MLLILCEFGIGFVVYLLFGWGFFLGVICLIDVFVVDDYWCKIFCFVGENFVCNFDFVVVVEWFVEVKGVIFV